MKSGVGFAHLTLQKIEGKEMKRRRGMGLNQTYSPIIFFVIFVNRINATEHERIQ